MAKRCSRESKRLARISPALVRRLSLDRCESRRCEALREHVASDVKELHADLRAGRCAESAIVLDHLEMIARRSGR